MTTQPTSVKIAYLGGGSRYWARGLMAELAQTPRLTGHIDLYDLDHRAAARNVAVGAAVFGRPEARTRFTVRATRRLADALRGADFVVCSIEPGPVRLRHADLVIPARHGILQPVGDTTGPGGILRALRAIPTFREFGAAIAAHCPRAWVINYTNPMTLCTAALRSAAPGLRALGCCHEVFHTQSRLAGLVAEWFGVPRPPRQEIRVDLSGVNHFTWVTAATWRGRDLLGPLRRTVDAAGFFRFRAAFARRNRAQERWFTSAGLIACDLFRRFGALGAAGDRHLAEFVPWYLGSEAELLRWGAVLTPYSWRLRRTRLKDLPPEHYARTPLAPTDEEGVVQMEALLGLGDLDTNVNLPNTGQAPDLPLGAVVETNAQFRRGRLTPLPARPLPAGARALVRRVMDVQQLTLAAALARDVDLAFQAVLADPLVRLSPDEAWRMFRAMLRATRAALPGWRIP
ncbi:MAG: hypothetical protein JNG83_15280 [Opitutaceae bacterium]|nr:hypothetical protein [Opitutaceae bacterium]